MRVLLVFAVLFLLGAVAASAHTWPARRSIAVQADENAVVVLVVWTAPAGDAEDVFDIGAALAGKGKKRRAALEAQLAARAIGPLTLTLDGKPLDPASLRTRLIEDPPKSGRRGVAVLVEAPISAAAHELVVALGVTGDSTRMNYLNRSQGRAIASGRVPEGGLVPAGTSFTVRWKEAAR